MKYQTLMLGLLGLAGNCTASEFDFAPWTQWHTGSNASSVAVGDIDGDGRDDVVVTTDYLPNSDKNHNAVIFKQTADGGLTTKIEYRYTNTASTSLVAPVVKLGDMNNDGIKDIVIGYSGGLVLLRATSAGVFVRQDMVTDRSCFSIALADLDINGNLDIVCGDSGYVLSLYYGNGKGGIASVTPLAGRPLGDSKYDIKVGDVNSDGVADMVVTSDQNSWDFQVYPGNGQGFDAALNYAKPEQSWPMTANAIGDFNADGRNDVLIAISGGLTPENSHLWLYLQAADGTLGNPVSMGTQTMPSSLLVDDLDLDGRQDLLVGHQFPYFLSRHMQNSLALDAEVTSSGGDSATLYGIGSGDINGDGCTDAVLASYLYGIQRFHGMNCRVIPRRASLRNDFNGDGKADLFWRNVSSGANAIWRSANYALPQTVTGVTNTNWAVIGSGDFNGDGKSDLLWNNKVTGENAIWRAAINMAPQPITHVSDPKWKVAAIGDFDADGKHDLLWRHLTSGRNVIWHSANSATQRTIAVFPSMQWLVTGTGDFDADGRDDILWHNATTGASMIWQSRDQWKPRYLTTVRNPAWIIAGVADFDGDRRADILWRDTTTGVNAIWRQGYYTLQQPISTLPGTMWRVAATGDYDGDGRHDVAWRNNATGENVVWKSASAHTPLDITDITNLQWEVQP